MAAGAGRLYECVVSADIARTGPRIGTWDWLTETGGSLTAQERLAFVPSLVSTFGRFSVDRLRLALRVRARHSFNAEDLWPVLPDSRLSRHADEEARDLQSLAIVNHGYRTWVFGAALASIDGVSIEPELFHAASLLHDVGLEHIEPRQCFTRRSAESAEAVAERSGLDRAQALEMMNGIAMHITPGLRLTDSALGFYLQAGAMADLVGIRAWQLPEALRARASATYPREQAHQVLAACWHAEAKAVPNGRAHFADAWSGFSRIVRWLPVEK